MHTISKLVNNKNGSVDRLLIQSSDNYKVNLNDNYKIVNFYKVRKNFSDTMIGADIGISSKGFISVILTATLIAMGLFVAMLLSFRI